MSTNLSLKEKYPHIFNPFVRAFGGLPKCLWPMFVNAEDMPAVQQLIKSLERSKLRIGKPNRTAALQFDKHFLSGMTLGLLFISFIFPGIPGIFLNGTPRGAKRLRGGNHSPKHYNSHGSLATEEFRNLEIAPARQDAELA